MKKAFQIIAWSLIALLAVNLIIGQIKKEGVAEAAVPATVRIKQKIVSTGNFSPEEIEVYEIPRAGANAPLKFEYRSDRPKKLRRIYTVDESGEKFFPDLDGVGTAPVSKFRVRVSRDNRVVSDTTVDQKIGDPVPDFPSDANIEMWVSFSGYPGRVFQVVEYQRRWRLFSGY